MSWEPKKGDLVRFSSQYKQSGVDKWTIRQWDIALIVDAYLHPQVDIMYYKLLFNDQTMWVPRGGIDRLETSHVQRGRDEL